MSCPCVVIIEDDRDIRESVHDILEAEGYSVQSYANGKEALDGLRHCPDPCLILLDLMMPVMDGFQFLEARKTIADRITAVPIIIVSAWAERAANEPGVKGYLKKPVDIDILLRMVAGHCKEGGRAA